ncbi:hypothetical protein HDV57DRAFT_244034 [Trichoderma longibrachiatum]
METEESENPKRPAGGRVEAGHRKNARSTYENDNGQWGSNVLTGRDGSGPLEPPLVCLPACLLRWPIERASREGRCNCNTPRCEKHSFARRLSSTFCLPVRIASRWSREMHLHTRSGVHACSHCFTYNDRLLSSRFSCGGLSWEAKSSCRILFAKGDICIATLQTQKPRPGPKTFTGVAVCVPRFVTHTRRHVNPRCNCVSMPNCSGAF